MQVLKTGAWLLALSLSTLACTDDNDDAAGTEIRRFEFSTQAEGWTGGFADHPELKTTADSALYQLAFGWSALPSELAPRVGGLKLQGHNRSDDLFQYVKRQLTGLRPLSTYQVELIVEIGSNAPSNAVGIGGAPGESVFVKAGALSTEPRAVLQPDGQWRMNVDIGSQSQESPTVKVLGNLANGAAPVSSGNQPYRSIVRRTSTPLRVQTDAGGSCWLLVGTDSGFEGLTVWYLDRLEVRLEPVSQP